MTQEEKNIIKLYENFLTHNIQTEGEVELVAKQHLLTDDDSGFPTSYLLSFAKHHIAHTVIKAAVEFLALGYMLRDFFLEEFLFGYQLASNALQESLEDYAQTLNDLADGISIEELHEQFKADNRTLERAVLNGRVAYAD